MLLVVDNVEHLPDAAGTLATLLASSPGTRLLATSRVALGLPGETYYDVGGLGYPADDDAPDGEAYDAVNLFARAARRLRADAAWDAAQRQGCVRVARLLDGHPLGLELAAAWTRVLQPTEIADELARDLSALDAADDAGGPARAGAPPRHRSLRAAFDHSWRLLSPEQQRALARVSVFRGGFTRAAAAAVTDVGTHALLALSNASLLRRTTSGRFEPHVTVREFADEELERREGEAAGMRERHARHFLAWIDDITPRLRGAQQADALREVEAEHDNLRAALGWARVHDVELAQGLAGRLWPFWFIRGHYQEGRAWLGAIVALAGGDATEGRARALMGAAVFTELAGDLHEAVTLYRASIDVQAALGSDVGVAVARVGLGITARKLADLKGAREQFEAALRTYEALGDLSGMGHCQGNLAILAADENDLERARRHLREALALAERSGDVRSRAIALNNLGDIDVELGELDAARERFHASFALHEELGDEHALALGNIKLGLVDVGSGGVPSARRRFEKALATMRRLGEPLDTAAALHDLALADRVQGMLGDALARELEALDLVLPTGEQAIALSLLDGVAAVALAAGETATALALAAAVEALRRERSFPRKASDARTLAPLLEALATAQAAGNVGAPEDARAAAPADAGARTPQEGDVARFERAVALARAVEVPVVSSSGPRTA